MGFGNNGFATSLSPTVRTAVTFGCRRLITSVAYAGGREPTRDDLPASSGSSVAESAKNDDIESLAKDLNVNPRQGIWFGSSSDPYYAAIQTCTRVLALQGQTGVPIPVQTPPVAG